MQRMKVVVADDEELACKGMRDYIPWNNFGLELVGCAADGADALALLERTKAEVLVTDIMMPGMNGLELISELEARGLKTLVIIISAYDQFEYAQKAMRHRAVVDYMLKPFDHSSFCECLRELPAKWEELFVPKVFSQAVQASYSQLSDAEYEEIQKRAQNLMTYIRKGLAEEAMDLAHTMPLYHAGVRPDQYFQTALRTVSELAMRMDWTLSELGHSRKLHGADGLLPQLSKCRTVEELRQQLEFLVDMALNIVAPGGTRRMPAIIRSCLAVIEENYNDPDFSLSQLALQLKMSPNYISNRLKQETGDTFIKILNKKRVEHAKELLADATIKVYEICDRVGLRDPHYFARVFREHTGMTPSEYRETL